MELVSSGRSELKARRHDVVMHLSLSLVLVEGPPAAHDSSIAPLILDPRDPGPPSMHPTPHPKFGAHRLLITEASKSLNLKVKLCPFVPIESMFGDQKADGFWPLNPDKTVTKNTDVSTTTKSQDSAGGHEPGLILCLIEGECLPVFEGEGDCDRIIGGYLDSDDVGGCACVTARNHQPNEQFAVK